MEHSRGAFRIACDIQIVGTQGPGRPKMVWKKLTENTVIGTLADQASRL